MSDELKAKFIYMKSLDELLEDNTLKSDICHTCFSLNAFSQTKLSQMFGTEIQGRELIAIFNAVRLYKVIYDVSVIEALTQEELSDDDLIKLIFEMRASVRKNFKYAADNPVAKMLLKELHTATKKAMN